MSLYSLNKETPLFVNSVGLTNLFLNRKAALKAIRQARLISVRDISSRMKLRRHRIATHLAPDVVHCLPKLYKPNIKQGVGIIIQFSIAFFNRNEEDKLIAMIVKVSRVYDLPIVFLPAGTSFLAMILLISMSLLGESLIKTE